MCNINESPCQPQVGARCLFVLQGEWNGCSYKTNWFRYFSVFSKVFLYNLRKASKKTFCAHLRWSVEFVCKSPCCSGISNLLICSRSYHCLWYQRGTLYNKNQLGVRPLYRQNSISGSPSTAAASISSLMLNFHPVHPLV